jgi:hypothetical protein
VNGGDQVLSGSIDGQFVLSENGKELRRWQIGKRGNVHWAEHLDGNVYLLASDMRAVARVDITNSQPIFIGKPFTRDDLEHVTYNHTSNRAYVASFDRQIYEIDAQTCAPVRIAYNAPFKCRWIKTLEREPSTLIVQSRNGGLYKVDSDIGECVGVIKETPEVLWTAVHLEDGVIALAGDGEFLLQLRSSSVDPITRSVQFDYKWSQLSVSPSSYTKRMVFQESSGKLILGRTNGEIVVVNRVSSTEFVARLLINVGSAVRDLAVEPYGTGLFAGCEDGNLYRINLETGNIDLCWCSPINQPLWAIAHCPERSLIAASERGGTMVILDDSSFLVLDERIETARPKRMKFVDGSTLLYNKTDELFLLNLNSGEESLHVQAQGNTIEDFVWDRQKKYLILISYTQNLILCDFRSGEVINTVPDQIDYSKGIILINTPNDLNGYPLDFLTFGRSGTAQYFRIHDEKILALGPVCPHRFS